MTHNNTKKYPDPTPEQKAFADAVIALYAPDMSRFNKASNGNIYMAKNTDKTKPLRLNRGYLFQHLRGNYAVCVFGQENGSKLTCFDVDAGGWPLATKALDALTDIGIPREDLQISTSGGKGYHIEIFYDAIVPYNIQQHIYAELLRRTEADTRQIELRPTYTQSIKLPLSRHHKTGNTCWFLNPDTGEEIHDYAHLQSVRPISSDLIYQIASDLPEILPEVRKQIYDHAYSVPVNLNTLPRIEEPGTRHHLVMRIAISLYNQHISFDDAYEVLFNWYEEQAEQISTTPYSDGLRDLEGSLRWVYAHYIPGMADFVRMSAQFSACDILSLLNIRSFAARVIFFHTLVWQRATGKCKSTIEYIAEHSGLSNISIRKTRDKMESEGILSVDHGKTHYSPVDGYWRDKPQTQIIKYPNPKEIPDSAFLRDIIEIDPMSMNADFWRTYFNTIFALIAREEAVKHMGKREQERLSAYDTQANSNLEQEGNA